MRSSSQTHRPSFGLRFVASVGRSGLLVLLSWAVLACGDARVDSGNSSVTGVGTGRDTTPEGSSGPGASGGGDSGGASTGRTETGGDPSTSSDGGSGADSGDIRFDVGQDSDGGGNGGDGGSGCECTKREFSHIWVADTMQGTVSKIDTRTLVEQGRYRTGPDDGRRPSRTSVSVDGNAMVVANRLGGVAKYWSRPELCQDTNGTPGIQTSTGPADVFPFRADECLAWYTPFPELTTQRPVQWTAGQWDETVCAYIDQKVWTVGGGGGVKDQEPGFCDNDGVIVYRLDGDTGAIEEELRIPDSEFPCGIYHGPYGAAVDSEGNLWFQRKTEGKYLARVDFVTLDLEVFDLNAVGNPSGAWAYGITVDRADRVWLSGGLRFDYAAGQMDTFSTHNLAFTGLAWDPGRGRIWWSDPDAIHWLDAETLVEGAPIPWPDGVTNRAARGVSVDIDGFLWAVRHMDDVAFKVDPDTGTSWTVTGLRDTYTYSDMTGGQLADVGGCTPPTG